MGYCRVCGGGNRLSYTCNECSGRFCDDHRLPEKHHCSGLSRSVNPWGEKFREESSDDETSATDTNDPGYREPAVNKLKSRAEYSSPPDVKTTTERNKTELEKATDSGRGVDMLKSVLITVSAIPLAAIFFASSTAVKLSKWAFSPKNLAVIIVALLAVSATVGTGYAPLDGPVQETAAGIAGAINETASDSNGRQERPSSSGESGGLFGDEKLDEKRVEELIHKEINERRVRHQRGELRWEGTLAKIAQYHSDDMVKRSYYAHEGPNGETMSDRYDRHAKDCRTYAENIMYTWYQEELNTQGDTYYSTNEELARGIVNGWMNSSGHRENILNAQFSEEGIGVTSVETDEGAKVYATQNFCG